MAGGRPKKELDIEEFEKLCALQCTEEEMCSWFNVDDKTLTRWCKDTYNMSFSEIFKIKRSKGKVSLRRTQMKMAKTNVTMAIWLGKQYLGQTDKIEQSVGISDSRQDLRDYMECAKNGVLRKQETKKNRKEVREED